MMKLIREHKISAVIALLVVAPLTYFALDRDPPFERIRAEFEPPQPRPGQWVTVRWFVEGRRWCPGTLRRQIIDSHGVVWSLELEPIAFGTMIPVSKEFLRAFQLPPGAWPGRAIYRVQTSYMCNHNPLHKWWPIVTTGPDVPFDIAAQ